MSQGESHYITFQGHNSLKLVMWKKNCTYENEKLRIYTEAKLSCQVITLIKYQNFLLSPSAEITACLSCRSGQLEETFFQMLVKLPSSLKKKKLAGKQLKKTLNNDLWSPQALLHMYVYTHTIINICMHAWVPVTPVVVWMKTGPLGHQWVALLERIRRCGLVKEVCYLGWALRL